MSDFMEYAEYYKKAWEKSLKERTSELQEEIKILRAENARYREALTNISIPDPVVFDGLMAYSYKMIAREALRGDITPEKGDK